VRLRAPRNSDGHRRSKRLRCTSSNVIRPNWTILGVGGGLFAVSMLVGALLMPHDNLVDVVNAWNQAHPDRPLAIAPTAYVSDSTPLPASPATP
jgi:hypothetical protein